MVLLLWCVCGGFLLHMLEANYLTILLKPKYEKPIDTAQDVFDRGLKVIYPPNTKSIVDGLKESPYIITRTLAERTEVAKVILLLKKIHFRILVFFSNLTGSLNYEFS